jgi:predicted lipoprotein with Yx(FWY)xxD motif
MSRAVAVLLLAALSTGCAAGEDAPVGGESADPQRTPPSSPSVSTTSPSETAAPSSEPTKKPAPDRAGAVIVTAGSAYGPMLFDASRQAIYLFDKEKSSVPRCYGPCAEAWPPVLTSGAPRARQGADGSLLGTVQRTDGTSQVTYAGHPLYFYAHEGRGQVLCHDIREFGGLWLVVTPEGRAAPSES